LAYERLLKRPIMPASERPLSNNSDKGNSSLGGNLKQA
jgi:hypothetical protein